MDTRFGKEPLSISAYKVIKGRILERLLQPGDQLVEADLAEQLGMSRTPVRGALDKLEQEGLVVSIRNRGTFVESLISADVMELYDILEVTEGLAARLLAQRVTRGQADILENLAAKADDIPSPSRHDTAFHWAIVRLSGSQKLVEIFRAHCENVLTYNLHTCRHSTGAVGFVTQCNRVAHAHTAIAANIIAGNPTEAEASVRRHVRQEKFTLAKSLLGIEDVR